MSTTLRIVLVVISVLVAIFALRKIRKSQLAIDDSIYWIFISALLLVLSIFPGIAIWAAEKLGIQSPANFVFLVMIFFVTVKLFYVSIELSVHKHRLNYLVQKLALLDHTNNRNHEEEKPAKEEKRDTENVSKEEKKA